MLLKTSAECMSLTAAMLCFLYDLSQLKVSAQHVPQAIN